MHAQLAAPGLFRESGFRRFLIASVALHVVGAVALAWTPRWRRSERPLPVVVVDAAVLDAAPPAPEPPPAEQPEPEPEVVPPTPPPPRQQVEEAVVIPPTPRNRPERPPPPPRPPEPPPPAPPPPEPPPPTPPPPSAQELIQKMRERVGDTSPSVEPGASGGPGIVDPEMASYQAKLRACFYTNWIGIGRYRRRSDLQVEFDVRVTTSGAVIAVRKTRASGEPVLDESAERAIRRCSPFPPAPNGQTDFHFTFVPGEVS